MTQALFGLRTDLDLNVGLRYSMSAAIFYPGFICGAYPAIVLAQRYPIERVIFGIVLLWGMPPWLWVAKILLDHYLTVMQVYAL